MNDVIQNDRAQTLALIRSKMDHDLRSNLNVILGYCSMLTEELESPRNPEEVSADLACIAAAGQELLYLNGQVGDLIEIQQGKWKLMAGEVVVDHVLQDAIDSVTTRFPHHAFDLDGTAKISNADARSLERLLGFTLTHLGKAASTPAKYSLRVSQDQDGATIEIECDLREHSDGERRKLERSLASLGGAVPHLGNIQDFDGYYRTIMCELAAVEIVPKAESLACTVRVDGNIETSRPGGRMP